MTHVNASTWRSGVAPDRGESRRWVAGCGAIYVAAWLVGLVIAPASPDADASRGLVHAFYAAHPTGVLIQSLLVHGLAGVALVGLAWSIPAALGAAGGWRAVTWVCGLAAALVSLCQVGFAVAATQGGAATAAAQSAWCFHAINDADSLKLLLLGGFVAAVSGLVARAGRLPRWLLGIAAVLAPLLPLSGAGYLADDAVLLGLLYVSLPVLLIWAAAVCVVVGRPPRFVPAAGEATAP